jgi:soluble lytic murein transglycosylase-like protein
MSGLVIRRFALLAGFVFALSGCGGGGFVPGGPHSISSAALTRIVNDQSSATKVPPRLIMAVIRTESGGDPSAISRAGAQGLMQLMPSTSMLYNVGNPFDPASNVAGGAHYLRDLLARYHGNLRLALAAYNAGPAAVDAAHGIPAILETRAYVTRVTAAYKTN